MRIFFRKVLYWAEEPQVRALVCLTFRVRMLCDAKRFLLSGGQARDVTYAQSLLDETYIPSLRGRPCQRCRWLLAQKGNAAGDYGRYRVQLFGWLKEIAAS